MIEFIGGITMLVATTAPIVVFVLFLIGKLLDILWGIIDDKPASDYFEDMGDKAVDFVFSESPSDFRIACQSALALFYFITVFIAVLVINFGEPNEDVVGLYMWPIHFGEFLSPAIVPVLLVIGSVYTARILRRLQKKVVKLKDTLTDHMKNKDAHKSTQGDSE